MNTPTDIRTESEFETHTHTHTRARINVIEEFQVHENAMDKTFAL